MISITLMPVSVSVSIMMTTTFFTVILAFLIQKEAISWREQITILCGFCGVVLVSNPDWFNPQIKGSILVRRELADEKEYPHYYLGCLFAILFAIFSGMNMVTIRDMGGNMYVSLKTYYFGVFSTIVSFIICIIVDPETL